MNIRDEIVAGRRARIEREGHALGYDLSSVGRTQAATPAVGVGSAALGPVSATRFGGEPYVICEIKRRSPSRGEISAGLNAVELAGRYVRAGATSLSVLTEEDYFAGSLADLVEVKRQFPGTAVLRKDFLVDTEDVEISARAGADAVLLIASILDAGVLAQMHARAYDLGMRALVEVHDSADVAKVRELAPELIGINARDLTDFSVDLLRPIRVRREIDWNAQVVFESGVHSAEHAAFAAAEGFGGILVGESVVREPRLVGKLTQAFRAQRARYVGRQAGGNVGREVGSPGGGATEVGSGSAAASGHGGAAAFWSRLLDGPRRARVLVKMCGMAREEDVRAADDLGADIVGFVFADSPRAATPELVRRCRDTAALKAAVVVNGPGAGRIDVRVRELLDEGLIDVVQLHGDEDPEACYDLAFPYYKAVRLREAGDVAAAEAYRCPRRLVDAYSAVARGGTGVRIDNDLIEAARRRFPLWLAGGLTAEIISEVVEQFEPELVDVSSGLEHEPGAKDYAKMRKFMRSIE